MSACSFEIPTVQPYGGELVSQTFFNVMCDLDNRRDRVGDIVGVEQNRVPVVRFRDCQERVGFIGEQLNQCVRDRACRGDAEALGGSNEAGGCTSTDVGASRDCERGRSAPKRKLRYAATVCGENRACRLGRNPGRGIYRLQEP